LLELDPAANQLQIFGFRKRQLDLASQEYLAAEWRAQATPGRDAVLVSVDSLAALERAYPNYFADTSVFLALLSQTLTNAPRKIPA
jgi:hypothetical protein